MRGTATVRRGKRNTNELLIRYAVLSQPEPISFTLTGLSAGQFSSMSERASSGVTTQSGVHVCIFLLVVGQFEFREKCSLFNCHQRWRFAVLFARNAPPKGASE